MSMRVGQGFALLLAFASRGAAAASPAPARLAKVQERASEDRKPSVVTTTSSQFDLSDDPRKFEFEAVRADDGSPVPFAEVDVAERFDADWRKDAGLHRITGRADAAGRFTIRASGHFDFSLRASGLGATCSCGESPQFRVGAMNRVPLTSAITLEMRVVDAHASPVRWAKVIVMGSMPLEDFAHRKGVFCGEGRTPFTGLEPTDADGRLAPQDYKLPRRIAFWIEHDDARWLLPSISLEGDAPGSRRELELRLGPMARLEGTVRHADGSRVDKSFVHIERLFDAWSSAEEDFIPDREVGSYRASAGPPGDYRVTFEAFRDVDLVTRIRKDVSLPEGVTNLDFVVPDDVPVGSDPPTGEARQSRGSIRGRLVADTLPEPDARSDREGIAFLLRDGDVVDRARCTQDGLFEFPSVRAGTYSTILLLEGCARFDGRPFELAPAGSVELPDVSVAPVPPFRGRVVDLHGRPVERVEIHAGATMPRLSRSCAGRFFDTRAWTDSEGRFELPGIGGPAAVLVRGDGTVPRIVALPEGGRNDAIEIVVPAPRAIRGRIVVAGGLPEVKFQILVDPSSETGELGEAEVEFAEYSCWTRVPVQPDGTFNLSRVPPEPIVLVLVSQCTMSLARRLVPEGSADVDLGDWVLSSGVR
jgi:hypothetical protein